MDRNIITFIWFSLFLFYFESGRAETIERQYAITSKFTQTVTYDYLVVLPENFQPDQTLPLVLFLHGSAERGNHLEMVKKKGPFKKMEELKLRAILVAPQCPKGQFWNSEVLAELLDEVESKYSVDSARIYVTGLSMGGNGTWKLASHQPERFAAIAPICAGGNPSKVNKLANLPIWAFHGELDDIIPLEKAKKMIDAVKKTGGTPKFTVYPGVGHDSYTSTYNNPEFYEWLFAQRREPVKGQP